MAAKRAQRESGASPRLQLGVLHRRHREAGLLHVELLGVQLVALAFVAGRGARREWAPWAVQRSGAAPRGTHSFFCRSTRSARCLAASCAACRTAASGPSGGGAHGNAGRPLPPPSRTCAGPGRALAMISLCRRSSSSSFLIFSSSVPPRLSSCRSGRWAREAQPKRPQAARPPPPSPTAHALHRVVKRGVALALRLLLLLLRLRRGFAEQPLHRSCADEGHAHNCAHEKRRGGCNK